MWTASSLDADACSDLGYDSTVVRCSHCSLLLQHTNEPQWYDECKGCCKEGDDADASENAALTTYKRGRLELDLRAVYPGSELARFVNDYATAFGSGFSVANVPRVPPRIVLLGEDGQPAETTRVMTWRCDLIVEYLQKKLARL